ncbi:PAS domain-containing sensor histidine kinase [Spirosoma fluminis]
MSTDQPSDALFAQFFDALPDSAFYLKSVRTDQDELIDFLVAYSNEKGRTLTKWLFQADVGERMFGGDSQRQAFLQPIFRQYGAVLQTGEPQEFNFLSPLGHGLVHVTRSRMGDGILVVVRNVNSRDQQPSIQPELADLLSGILEASLNGIIMYEAIRNESRAIVDFRFVRFNTAARQMMALTDAVVGKSMLDELPGVKEANLFDQFVRVVDSGYPARFETSYPKADGLCWYEMSVVKLGDGFVITFNDITQRKQAALEVERAARNNKQQADLLHSVLNNSPSGIKALEAVRDEAGQIIDFSVTVINKAGADVRERAISDLVGQRALATFPGLREAGLFDQYIQVVESGEPRHLQSIYYGDVWYTMDLSPFGDGLVVTYTNISDSKQAALKIEQQANFLNSVLDASSNGIIAGRAIRNADGDIVDFLIESTNRQAAKIVQLTVDEMLGHSDLELRPRLREAGIFDVYVKTLETGEPQFIETYYNDGRLDQWVNINTRKIGQDELVVTFASVTDFKRTQQALEEAAKDNKRQANLLNSILNSSPSGIMSLEAIRNEAWEIVDFWYVIGNASAGQLLGFPLETLLANSLLTNLPGTTESGLFSLYVQTVESGEPKRDVIRYNYDGLDNWFDVSTRQLGDGLVVTFSDVTEQKRASMDVEQTADLLQAIVNSSPTALVLYEPIRNHEGAVIDFSYKFANPVAAAATGRPLDYMQGNTLFSMFPVAAQQGFFDRLQAVLQTGELQQYEQHFLGDEVDLWAEITMVKQGTDVLTVFQYITELKRAQQQLERLTVELQTVIDTSQTGIFLFTPVRDETGDVVDFRFRVANRQLASYVGQSPETVIGALGSTWFPDYKTNTLFERYRHTYVTGETLRFDFHYDGSGIDVWLDIMSTKMGDEVLVTFGDYTPLKRLQKQLETSVVELQRSNKNLEQFAYVASHDLQEPLRKIQAFGDVIQSQYAPLLGPEGSDMINRMQSAAARMQVLIKDVLAYSRIATKREAIHSVNLNLLIQEVLTDLENAIAEKQASVLVDTLPKVNGDLAQLRQLFQNLISNSLKFVQTGRAERPKITITVKRVIGHQTTITVLPADLDREFHLIEVADNGIGFEPHHAERIFQVFQRLHSRSEYQGTGIGLAIVQKVVENHQGYIAAEGRPGEGATFRVFLPA